MIVMTMTLIRPYADEVCDGVDNDCNGIVDDSVANTYYADSDNDGYGDVNSTAQGCSVPQGYVANADDGDDTDLVAILVLLNTVIRRR